MNTPAWVWVPPFAYAAHIADEFFAGDGFCDGVGEFTEFSARSLLGVNLRRGEPSRGLVTRLAILLPATLVGFRWSVRSLSRRAIGAGVVAGCVLFASQDLWRVLFNRLIGPGA